MRLTKYLWVAVSALAMCTGQTPDSAAADNVSFDIVTDKLVYSPHSKMLVKFLIANKGPDNVYIHRSITVCGSLYGQYELQVLDSAGRNVRTTSCSSDFLSTGQKRLDPISEVRSGNWIELRPGQVYGWQEEFELPSAKGLYQLNATLAPPGLFDAQQKETLQHGHIRILTSRHQAEAISVTVK
jgi:hypothetical protein